MWRWLLRENWIKKKVKKFNKYIYLSHSLGPFISNPWLGCRLDRGSRRRSLASSHLTNFLLLLPGNFSPKHPYFCGLFITENLLPKRSLSLRLSLILHSKIRWDHAVVGGTEWLPLDDLILPRPSQSPYGIELREPIIEDGLYLQ